MVGWVRGGLKHSAHRAIRGVLASVVLACLSMSAAWAADDSSTGSAETPSEWQSPHQIPRTGDFKGHGLSAEAREVVQWIVRTSDNRGLPFVVVDKVQARVHVFYAEGRLRGTSPALVGLAVGDDSVPGIGNRTLASIKPEERTTPAGRFVAALGRDVSGPEVLWVDYDSAVSLHRVVPGTRQERRAQRLASPSPLDKRITYGCINVPVRFYEEVVSPSFKGTHGVVYVLPETRSVREVFGSSVEAALD